LAYEMQEIQLRKVRTLGRARGHLMLGGVSCRPGRRIEELNAKDSKLIRRQAAACLRQVAARLRQVAACLRPVTAENGEDE